MNHAARAALTDAVAARYRCRMYTPDLATACQVARGPAVRAIGWLERGQPFPTGPVDPRFLAALRAQLTNRWLPVVSCGVHACDLGACGGAAGAQHVIIPSPRCVYVAPDLVAHYVEAHAYAPPAELVDAVLACPAQSSDAYVELLLPHAGIWNLDEVAVRRIAAAAREAAAPPAREGGFRW